MEKEGRIAKRMDYVVKFLILIPLALMILSPANIQAAFPENKVEEAIGFLANPGSEFGGENVAQDLGESKDPRAIDALINAMKNAKYPGVRTAATKALGNHSSNKRVLRAMVEATKDSLPGVRQYAYRTLAASKDSKYLPTLIAGIADPNPTVGSAAAYGIGQFGDAAIEPMIAGLDNNSPDIRISFARSLGKTRNAKAAASLLRLAKAPDSEFGERIEAIEALAEIDDVRMIRELSPLLCENRDTLTSEELRWRAEEVFAKTGRKAEIPCISNLADPTEFRQPWEKKHGPIYGETAKVKSALYSRYIPVRDNAVKSIVDMGAEGVWAIVNVDAPVEKHYGHIYTWTLSRLGVFAVSYALEEVSSGTSSTLDRIGKPLIAPLSKIVRGKQSDRAIRFAALRTLGSIRDPSVVSVLAEALDDPEPEVRVLAVLGLANQVSDGAKLNNGMRLPLMKLIGMLEKDPFWGVKAAIGDSFARWRDPETVGPLVAAWRRSVGYSGGGFIPECSHHEEAMASIGAPSIPFLIQALSDPSPSIRERAVVVLTAIAMRHEDFGVVEPLIRAMADASVSVRLKAASGLLWTQDSRSVAPLVSAMTDADRGVRQAAIMALWHIPGDAATDAIRCVADDPSSDLREVAQKALHDRALPDGGMAGILGSIKKAGSVRSKIAVLKLADFWSNGGETRLGESLRFAVNNVTKNYMNLSPLYLRSHDWLISSGGSLLGNEPFVSENPLIMEALIQDALDSLPRGTCIAAELAAAWGQDNSRIFSRSPSGELVLELGFRSDGTVETVAARESTLGWPPLEEATVAAFRRLRVPGAGDTQKPVRVVVRF